MQSVQTDRPTGKWHATSTAPQPRLAKLKAPPAPPQSLRPKAAAELLGIGVATLWRWSADKERHFPKARRLSARCTVYDRAELLAWRDAQASK